MENAGVKTVVPYSTKNFIASAIFGVAAVTSLIISVLTRFAALSLVSFAMLLVAIFIILQNKKITVSLEGVCIKYFLGVIREQAYTPAECGFFVASASIHIKKVYVDKRACGQKIPSDIKKYIYISEYLLSDEEMSGSQYAYGEPVLIIPYSASAYKKIASYFEFNCEPFKA